MTTINEFDWKNANETTFEGRLQLRKAIAFKLGWEIGQSLDEDGFVYTCYDPDGNVIESGMSHYGAIQNAYWVWKTPDWVEDADAALALASGCPAKFALWIDYNMDANNRWVAEFDAGNRVSTAHAATPASAISQAWLMLHDEVEVSP